MYLRKPVVEHGRYSEDFDMEETQNWEEDKAKSKHCRIHKGNHWISFHWGLSEPIRCAALSLTRLPYNFIEINVNLLTTDRNANSFYLWTSKWILSWLSNNSHPYPSHSWVHLQIYYNILNLSVYLIFSYFFQLVVTSYWSPLIVNK